MKMKVRERVQATTQAVAQDSICMDAVVQQELQRQLEDVRYSSIIGSIDTKTQDTCSTTGQGQLEASEKICHAESCGLKGGEPSSDVFLKTP